MKPKTDQLSSTKKDSLLYVANLIGLCLMVFLLAGAAVLLLENIFTWLIYKGDTSQIPTWYIYLWNTLRQLACCIPAIVLLWKGGRKFHLKISFSKGKLPIYILLPLYLGISLIAAAVSTVLTNLVEGALKLSLAPPLPQSAGAIIFYIFGLCLLPAIWQEVLFRGAIKTLLHPWGAWFAIGISALLNGLLSAHIGNLLATLLLSVALGYVAEITDSILPCMLLHFCGNLLIYFITITQTTSAGLGALAFATWAFVLLIACFVAAIVWVVHQNRKNQFILSTKSNRYFKLNILIRRLLHAPFFIIAFILSLVYYVASSIL